MNILFLSHRIPYPPNKGEKIRTYHQIEYLNGLGHNVSVLSPSETALDNTYSTQLAQKLSLSSECISIGNRKIKLLLGLLKGKALSVSNFYDANMQDVVDMHIQQNAIDVIICSASSMAEYVFKSSCDLSSIKLIMDFMDLDSDKWQQYAQRSTVPKKWIYQREQKLLSRYEQQIESVFDHCFFISDIEVKLFSQNLKSAQKVHTIANGIDTDTFKNNPQRNFSAAPNLLFTGVMDYLPNVDAVVWFAESVWPKIISQYPEAKFYIAGMNPNETVKALQKQKGIVVTGFVDDIMPYYNQATLFVAPFRIARGVQNKVLQAMACGLPVVTTPSGGEGINYTPNIDLIIVRDEKEILDRVLYCINHPEKAAEIGQNACKLISEHFSWKGKLAFLNQLISANSKS